MEEKARKVIGSITQGNPKNENDNRLVEVEIKGDEWEMEIEKKKKNDDNENGLIWGCKKERDGRDTVNKEINRL